MGGPCFVFLYEQIPARGALIALDLTRCAQVEAASSSLPAAFQKENTILTDGVSFWSGRRGSTRYRHPTNGRAIRRSPAGPLDLTRSAPVEAACSRLSAVFQKENTILTDGVSFCDFPQVLLSALPPTAKAKNVTRLDSLPASHEWQSHSQEPCRTS